jgi:hypothetical protein
MDGRGFIGIESDKRSGWMVVKRVGAQLRQCRRFADSPAERLRLVDFIRENCRSPKVGLRATSAAALGLLRSISGIPDVEVVLISEQGIRAHEAWLPELVAHPYMQTSANNAELLARYAERLI